MYSGLAILSFLVAVSSPPAGNQFSEQQASPPTQPIPIGEIHAGSAGENDLVCRKTRITGSKFKKRICATEEQWDRLSQKAQREAKRMQDRGRGTGNPYGG